MSFTIRPGNYLIALDPGLSTGWCIADSSGIVECGVGEQWPLTRYRNGSGVIERPEIYNPQFMKGDPNDILTLAIRVGRYIERLDAQGIFCEEVLPKDWKGQLSKTVHHNRAKRKLTIAERSIIDAADAKIGNAKVKLDLWDAVCLALWKTGRLPKDGQL